jgi:intein/homing endonuclease
MKAIQLLVNSQLPPDLRDYNREFDSKSLGSLMAEVARKYPDQYERISKAISDIGRKASYFQGESLTLADNRPVIDRDKMLVEMDNEIEDAKKNSADKEDFENKKIEIWSKFNDKIQKETAREALARKNNLAYSVMSGARGKPAQLKMMLSTPGLYTDAQDNIIPLFVRTSFAEGLRPAEYLAGTYGARKSVLCLQEDTLVRMADGSSLPIKHTKPGMFVLGADKEGNTFPVRVVRVYNQGLQPVSRYIFVNGQEVVCTKNHKFLSSDKKDILTIEDIAKDKDIISTILPAPISNCYDIEVEHDDHLFVLDSGLITSNSTKRATAKGGDLAKQMVQSAANLVVSENDCGAANGIDLESDDKSLRGRVLARDLGNITAGTVLDKNALASVRKQGFEKLIVRSPMTCQAKEGVCARCMGLNALGKFPAKGEAVGITAAQAIGEPICLHEDTLVRMADLSNKKIKDIVPGDMVLGSDMLGNLTPTRVVNVFHNGIRDGVRTKIKKGFGPKSEIIELISTKEHKVLSYQGLAVNKATPVIQPIAKKYYRHFVYLSKGLVGEYGADEPLADILGILIGDGCYTSGGSSGISLSCYDEVLEEYVRSKLDSVGLNLAVTATGEFRLSMKDQYSSFETIDGTLVRNTIKAKLIKEGMWGQDSGTKVLPSSIATWNNKSVASLIGGLIATDGWICRQKNNKNSITVGFGSNSLPLLQGVKDLLEIRFGIYSSRITGKHKKKANGELYATNYTLTVSGIPNIIELQKQISIPGCKQEKLNSYIYDVTSTAGHRGRYSVISQEPIGKIDTWDIEVANDTHLFCLHNSLIVSNTQGALNVKHQGGAAGTDRRYAGFSVINQFVQTPDTFPDKAVLSKIDGQVNSVIEAPQGGYYVTVDSEPHYVAPGYPVTVKVGDRVEAGDMVSEGLADPGEVVELRGLGEGRKYYADKLKQLLDDSGMEADRRNTELMARAALDHLQITDIKEDDEYLPDDVVSYSYFSNRYTPPKDTNKYKADKAVGTYLQSPALHYTIGTKITPKIAKHLKSSGFEEVFSSPESPTFKPHMVRLRAATHHGTDWLASMHTSYLKKQLSESAIRGEESDVEKNIHFAPRLAIGTNFGENIEQTGKF